MKFDRSSGILLHITSLPSPYGIGDMGPTAYEFIDFLNNAGQRFWQILPLNPTEYHLGNSPYSSPSAFAGNILLISPELLFKEGYLTKSDLKHNFQFLQDRVAFAEVIKFKKSLLEKAWNKFRAGKNSHKPFQRFCEKNKSWLEDYALFMAVKAHLNHKGWMDWPEELRDRKPTALKKLKEELEENIEKEKFLQFLFFSQWQNLIGHAREKNIRFIGDIPFYVSYDSADCWANAKYFKLDKQKKPVSVSGVPPDYFSETGQLWGTPIYDWHTLQKDNFNWWMLRVRQNMLLFDILRFDHFRAFSAYWDVPAGDDTAINGRWQKTPGNAFFKTIKEVYPDLPFIAEDLGLLDEGVHKLRDRFELPGMKVLQFAFGDNMATNPYIPHNHHSNNVVYTGTHDNNTVCGWFQHISKQEKKRLSAYLGRRLTHNNIAELFQRMCLMSVADLVIIPMQDILGLGGEAIMNRPGTASDNWRWRMAPGQLTSALELKLKSLNAIYGR
ncbi:4-alpha-glucanotransferase [Fulvivirga ulvae]|uniref:4-alpha-glucanotransferase n=1 Tax=Fulvivirga ulvae TaxID=2904245 RepID=UPI001F1D8F43|nr:4-alpha-glucanotransferase [Fulvivirga ulvae]UII34107.1 4-alpha-glucanotransferase [Fulvivirga ulvae]